jgi:hypothetical protein
MATSDSTGARRRRVRLDANRPRTHPKPRTRKPAEAPAPQRTDRSEHLSRQRAQLFKAISIIACCRLACVSLFHDSEDAEVMSDALQVAHELIDAAAGAMGD